ncbi:hypothetical protein KDD17_08940 [Sulfitobacter albidus]|uniref:Translation initiation factor 2 n=1 Tax=Sulfitobacter albidus TaxID=2829501 RepID=A0A975PLG2_9RHOB|nr:hypothetical protein [Sulfitobacter albidus]QUJ75155.1 hypothetical protein KDD17_08940 [Sulfitobacter albidus]
MKPNFALSLSFDGIKLLHRAAGGWREVGEVSLASEDMAGELAVLRKTASGLEPGGVRSKLLIPDSQIKYLTLETPGLSKPARLKEAAAALENATPYAVDELAFDISQDGPRTHVAAVARETLAEAEAFAQEHRFHPVSFVAAPEGEGYLGEPFFGQTLAASELLEEGESVEPDGIAVVVIGAASSERAPDSAPDAAPVPDAASEPVDVSEPAPAEPDQKTQAAPAPEPAEPEPQIQTVAEPVPTEPEPETRADPAASEPSPQKAKAPAPESRETAPAPKAAVDPDPAPPPQPEPEPVSASVADAAPDAQRAVPPPPQTPEPAPASQGSPEPLPDVPSAPDPAPVAARAETPSPAPGAGQPTQPTATPAPIPAMPSLGTAQRAGDGPRKPTVSSARRITAPTAEVPSANFASRRAGKPTLQGATRTQAPKAPAPDSSSLDQPAAVAAATSGVGGFLSRRRPRTGAAAPVPAPATTVAPANSEAERMTVFGARTAPVGGKPRFLGLIMTVVLLVFLAGVAAWAAVFLDDGIAGLLRDEDSTRTTASAPENQLDPEVIRQSEEETLQNAPATPVQDTQVAALDPVLDAPQTDAPAARVAPERPVFTPQEAAARYAVSGIWPLAPDTVPTPPRVDDAPVYRNSVDALSTAADAIALPPVEGFNTDVVLAAVPSPPPFGQVAALRPDGLLVPTEDGVVTPQGYTLIAASPPLKPPLSPTRFATTPDAPAAQADPRAELIAFRPRNRPGGLVENTERAQLGGVTRSELAAFRPSLRPRSLQERALEAEREREAEQEARAAAAAAAATAAAAAALALPDAGDAAATAPALDNATRFAVAQSVRPDTRPRNFARIVERAQRAAPQRETRVAAAASVAPRTVAPNIPSKASVARSATVKNAINLRRVNLIGVYGKPASRRALVRLSNGRYQKVKVGDRIDGGRVSAIGNSELRYRKGSRDVVLKMPRS